MKNIFYSSRLLKLLVIFLFFFLFNLCFFFFSYNSGEFITIIIYSIIYFLSLYIFKAFDEFTLKSLNQIIVSFAYATLVTVLILIAAITIFSLPISHRLFIAAFILSIVIIPLFQYFFFNYILGNMPNRKCIVLGKKEVWQDIIQGLSKSSIRQFDVIAYFDGDITEEEIKNVGQVDFLIDALPHLFRGENKTVYYQKFGQVFNVAKMIEKNKKCIPLEIFKEFEQYYELMFSEIRLSNRIKVLDFIYSFVLILLLSPILLFSILLIIVLDGGPIFYTQDRCGYLGQVFKIYKLCTMKETDEGVVSTRSGAILRKLRFNEIPQILNVLKGDMSLVGPRPDLLDTYKYCMDNIPYYKYRFNVLPGITGHAQVCYKYVDSLEVDTFSKRLSYDLYYVKYLSPYIYFTTLLRTVESVIMRKGQ